MSYYNTLAESLNNDTAKDVVLKPISGLRGKRSHNLPKGDLYAIVWLAENFDSQMSFGERFCHPEINLFIVSKDMSGVAPMFERRELLVMTYQRTDMTCSSESRKYLRGAKGFLRGASTRNRWSTAYAPKISGDMNYFKYFQAGVDLIERAKEAVSYDKNYNLARSLNKHDDDILTMIAGLQRIGVTVIVRNGRMAKKAPQYSLVA